MVQSGCMNLLLLAYDKFPENEILRTALLKIFCCIMQMSNDGKAVLICLGLKLVLEKTLCTVVNRDLRHFACRTLAIIHHEEKKRVYYAQKFEVEKVESNSKLKNASISMFQV